MSIQCPKCQFSFNAQEHLKDRITGPLSFLNVILQKNAKPLFEQNINSEVDESILTVCPQCHHEFQYVGYKFFGFISAKGLRYLIMTFFALFFAFILAIIIKTAMNIYG